MSRLIALLFALFALPAGASDIYVGTISTSGVSTNNSTTAVPFVVHAGGKYSIQCGSTVYVGTGSADNVTVSASDGIKLQGDLLFDVPLATNHKYIAILPVSGAQPVTCRVFSVSP